MFRPNRLVLALLLIAVVAVAWLLLQPPAPQRATSLSRVGDSSFNIHNASVTPDSSSNAPSLAPTDTSFAVATPTSLVAATAPPVSSDTPPPADSPTPLPPPTNTPVAESNDSSSVADPAPPPTAIPAPASSADVPALQPPFTPSPDEHWAEVDMGSALTRLYLGDSARYSFPMSYGRGGDPKTTTFPGVFHIYAKNASLHESIDPGHYIRNWVGFDPKWANGFHSVIMDSTGQIIDDRLGLAISSGCIRTALPNSAIIYNWLDYGERVWVHM